MVTTPNLKPQRGYLTSDGELFLEHEGKWTDADMTFDSLAELCDDYALELEETGLIEDIDSRTDLAERIAMIRNMLKQAPPVIDID